MASSLDLAELVQAIFELKDLNNEDQLHAIRQAVTANLETAKEIQRVAMTQLTDGERSDHIMQPVITNPDYEKARQTYKEISGSLVGLPWEVFTAVNTEVLLRGLLEALNARNESELVNHATRLGRVVLTDQEIIRGRGGE
ncbi:uncharacterized protein Z519_12739 [Cladophialophora bantiana CBS 173.52]|uniref:Uncharacterized protein n=1 Tax=Cladophialophora bantiana (strain ATCC 10958 / CBS 173.52 / CDC B-1940 / NIH 8579) TaxID=1442370 RepID=A0A0D2HQG1_CLAB1|nr:uncharacterized protein Z519_12739 [Cladophialophora bantiana CBS 173.52]KIW86684.1 hypothetical protein Z519_12739 [Cladophialophora bantiana CBS 173.52]